MVKIHNIELCGVITYWFVITSVAARPLETSPNVSLQQKSFPKITALMSAITSEDGGSTTTPKKRGNPTVREQYDIIFDDGCNQEQRKYRCRHCKTQTFKWAKFNSARANVHLSKCDMVPPDVRESCLGGTQAAKKTRRLGQQATAAHDGSIASPESSVATSQWDIRISVAEVNWDMPAAAGANRRERIEALEKEVLGRVARDRTFEERLRALE
jgi:hypothetical protein